MSESVRIKFHPNFPEQHEAEITRLLTPLLYVVKELDDIQISFSVEEGEATVMPLRRYHTAWLALDPAFFDLDFAEKEHVLVHELMHIKVDSYVREVMHILEAWVPEDVEAYVYARLDDAEETLVDDLARIFRQVLTEGEEEFRFSEAPKARTQGDKKK